MLNPEYLSIIENQRQKRSGLKPQQRQQFGEQSSPMNGSSTIKPTRLIKKHFQPNVSSNSNYRNVTVMKLRPTKGEQLGCQLYILLHCIL